MIRVFTLVACALLAGIGPAAAQKKWGPANITAPIETFSITEPVKNSDIPVQITFVETIDGLFTPIGIRVPKGKGPFGMVMFFTGNGGGGAQQVRQYVHGAAGYTMERYLQAGYAVAWLHYRAETWFEYSRVPALQVSRHQANQLVNRPPLEYNDLMSIVEYVKTLPYVDPKRIGLVGNSHGGGMILKAAAEGMDVAAAIASEPDSTELLQMKPEAFEMEEPMYPTRESVAPFLNKEIAMERLRRIKIPILFMNRDHDHLQGIFETAYDWMKEAGANVVHSSYDHPVHGYIIRTAQDEKGNYKPDDVQLKAMQSSLDFFKKYMAP